MPHGEHNENGLVPYESSTMRRLRGLSTQASQDTALQASAQAGLLAQAPQGLQATPQAATEPVEGATRTPTEDEATPFRTPRSPIHQRFEEDLHKIVPDFVLNPVDAAVSVGKQGITFTLGAFDFIEGLGTEILGQGDVKQAWNRKLDEVRGRVSDTSPLLAPVGDIQNKITAFRELKEEEGLRGPIQAAGEGLASTFWRQIEGTLAALLGKRGEGIVTERLRGDPNDPQNWWRAYVEAKEAGEIPLISQLATESPDILVGGAGVIRGAWAAGKVAPKTAASLATRSVNTVRNIRGGVETATKVAEQTSRTLEGARSLAQQKLGRVLPIVREVQVAHAASATQFGRKIPDTTTLRGLDEEIRNLDRALDVMARQNVDPGDVLDTRQSLIELREAQLELELGDEAYQTFRRLSDEVPEQAAALEQQGETLKTHPAWQFAKALVVQRGKNRGEVVADDVARRIFKQNFDEIAQDLGYERGTVPSAGIWRGHVQAPDEAFKDDLRAIYRAEQARKRNAKLLQQDRGDLAKLNKGEQVAESTRTLERAEGVAVREGTGAIDDRPQLRGDEEFGGPGQKPRVVVNGEDVSSQVDILGQGDGVPPGGGGKPPVATGGGAPLEQFSDPADLLVGAIRGAKQDLRDIATLRGGALKAKVGAFAGTRQSGSGRLAAIQARSKLKGALPKRGDIEPIKLSDDSMNTLFDMIRDSKLSPLDQSGADDALLKLLVGELPQRAEVTLLERVFGRGITKAVDSRRSNWDNFYETLQDIINLPRAINSSYDLSAMFRQGGILTVSHPVKAIQATRWMLKALVNEDYANFYDDVLRKREYFDLGEESGLFLASRTTGRTLVSGEEVYMSRLANKIPGIRASERAYVTYLNKLRADTFDDVARSWAGMARTPSDYQALARWVNIATGRGSLGRAERLAPTLNGLFFSPRFLASRIQVPLELLRASKTTRLMVAKDLSKFVGTGIGIMSMLALGGVIDVELDPRSSDFGKGRVGKTRFDFWAGFQPIARYTAQIITNERKTTGAGNVVGIDRGETITRFIQSKLSPVAGLLVDVNRGETFVGDELTLKPGDIQTQVFNRLFPFIAQDIWDATFQDGLTNPSPKGAIGGLATIGGNVQTFEGLRDVQDDVSMERYGVPYDELKNSGLQGAINRSEQVKEAIQKLEDRQKVDPDVRTSHAMDLYVDRKANLEDELRLKLQAGRQGLALGDAIKDFKESRFLASETLITDTVEAVLDGRSKPDSIEDAFAEQYWSVEAPEDAATGDIDFDKQDEARKVVLAEAAAAGVDTNYITGNGAEDYRQGRFEDPQVRAAVLAYEADQELLKPYWKAGQNLIGRIANPTARALWVEWLDGDQPTRTRLLAQASSLRTLINARDQERERVRVENPSVDMALVRWKGQRGHTPEGARLWEELYGTPTDRRITDIQRLQGGLRGSPTSSEPVSTLTRSRLPGR